MPSASDTSGLCARREDFQVKAAPVRHQFRIRFLTLLTAQLETPAAAWALLQAESIAPWATPSRVGSPAELRMDRGRHAVARARQRRAAPGRDCQPPRRRVARRCAHTYTPVSLPHTHAAAGPRPFPRRLSYKGGWWVRLSVPPSSVGFSLPSPHLRHFVLDQHWCS